MIPTIMAFTMLFFSICSTIFPAMGPLPRKGYWDTTGDIMESAMPVFTQPLSASPTSISPENQDGINDKTTLSFRPDQDGAFNMTIEEDIRTIDPRALSNALAGNSSRLLMLGSLNTATTFELFARFSTDLGMSWSTPVMTNLTDYNNATHHGSYYSNLDMVYNPSDGNYVLGAVKNISAGEYELVFFKSPDGIHWTSLQNASFVNTTVNPLYRLIDMNFDMILSTNHSEILTVVTNHKFFPDDVSEAYFIKLQQGGSVLKYTKFYSLMYDWYGIYSPAIAATNNSGCITCTWFKFDGAQAFYYLANSFDFGGTWSAPIILNNSRGFIPDITPEYMNFQDRTMQLYYEPSGKLDMTYIANVTSIFTIQSSNNGGLWTNLTNFRSYVGVQAFVYNLHVVILDDGSKLIAFIGALDGNVMANKITDFGTSYFIRVKTVISLKNIPVLAAPGFSNVWFGKDMVANFVRDGPYLVRVWIKNTLNQVNPTASEARLVVDNSPLNASITLSNPCFSPHASPGVKDTTDITLRSLKDATYDVFCDAPYGSRPETQVTTSESGDFHADVAMDEYCRLWCVYTSFHDHQKDLYLKWSDDFGMTFSLPIPLVVSSDLKDFASIAISPNGTIYIVYYQLLVQGNSIWEADLYLLKSSDRGATWSTPLKITNVPSWSDEIATTPDMVIVPNGTIYILYADKSLSSIKIDLIKSNDGGMTFSSPVLIRQTGSKDWTEPAAISYDQARQELVVVFENYTYTNSLTPVDLLVYNSSTGGSTWTMRSRKPGVVNEIAYLHGLTIDVLSNGTWRTSIISQITSIQILTIQSNDGGLTWDTVENYTLDSGIMLDFQFPWCDDEIRSGSSPFGDIFYAYARSPVSNPTRNVYLKPFTTTRQHYSGSLVAGRNKTLSWNGKDLWGTYCEEQNYTITGYFSDMAGNPTVTSVQCKIDNTAPVITAAIPPVASMLPSSEQTVAVRNSSSGIDYAVDLYYRRSETGQYTRLATSFNGTAFVQTIPVSPTNQVLFYFNATDQGGNSAIAGPWFYFEPTPFIIITSSAGNPNRALEGLIKIEVQGLPRSQLQDVYLSYKFNNMSTFEFIAMKYDNNSLDYVVYFNGSAQLSSIDYQIYIVRLGATDKEPIGLPATKTQVGYPLFVIEYPLNVIIVVVSTAFGLLLGIIQAHGRRTTAKRIQDRFLYMLRSYAKAEGLSPQSKKARAKDLEKARKERAKMVETQHLARGRIMYNFMTVGTIATIAGGALASLVFKSGGIGMLVSALGLMLSSLAFMERVNVDTSDAIYIDKKPRGFMAFMHLLLIILVLVVFMMSAPLVAWFNELVVQQIFAIGPVKIPRLYLSLVTPVITSVALIWISSYNELKKSLNRIELMRVAGENWKVIWQAKEETVSRLASNAALKIFIFLVTIVFAVITTTQIGQYAEQGVLIIVPFIITWLAVFLVGAITMPVSSVKDALKSWIIEKSKPCTKCNAPNLFESKNCTSCGASLAGETSIVEKTVECKACKERSPDGSKFCRGCGVTL
nr:hypothetical protein [Candidatus Sigynarchaeota archaeon]